jgi:WD40 repeat protein
MSIRGSRLLAKLALLTLSMTSGLACAQHAKPTPLLAVATPACDMTFSPDGKTLAVANDDSSVSLWNLASGKHNDIVSPFAYREGIDWNNSVVYSDRGDLLAVAYTQRAIVIRDVSGKAEKIRIPLENAGLRRMTFTNDGTSLLALVGESHEVGVGSYYWTPAVIRWDVTTGARQSTVKLRHHVVFEVLSPDGRFAVARLPGEPGGANDDGIQVIGTASGAKLFKIGGANFDPDWTYLGGSWVFSADGTKLVTCNQKGILIREVPSGRTVKHIKTEPIATTSSAALSTDGKRLAVASGTLVKVFNLETGKLLGEVNAGDSALCKQVVLSRDGRTMASQRSATDAADRFVGSMLKVWRLPDQW